MWVAKIIFFTNAHGDVAGDWFLGPELQLTGCNKLQLSIKCLPWCVALQQVYRRYLHRL